MLHPQGGSIVSEQFYAVGDFGDIGARVKKVLADPPALLVFNGGEEAAPFLSALHSATLDGGQRPEVEFPKRLAPAATIDYSQEPVAEDLVPGCLASATGFEPGDALTIQHENMMLNRSTEFLRTGYAYSQHGVRRVHDALPRGAARPVRGRDGARGGAPARSSPDPRTARTTRTCRRVMKTALEAGGRATVAYTGRMGPLELGPQLRCPHRADARIHLVGRERDGARQPDRLRSRGVERCLAAARVSAAAAAGSRPSRCSAACPPHHGHPRDSSPPDALGDGRCRSR